ncbi:MAG: DUF4011 domain-containing protein [Bradyrhizobiaceae bacterium]|nr:DUF4011 domain-containing protein [Bradyrhizobiaceae bacterium]
MIDLSMRNGMLNFKHSETSSRHVRVVDENLEFLVTSLASGESLDIIPLPPVEQVPRDEDTDAFRNALKAAKETDPAWLAAEDARRAAGNRRRVRDRVAERSIRDRVRAQLGMPPWLPAIDPKARAKELGIDPNYDLPPPATPRQPHHADRTVQTLFFPDRLEPKLSTLHSSARALQEDAGLSVLHVTIGFLEWFETEDSPEPAFAPLVLLPINMEKRIRNGEYIFSIAGRDDDETTNVALREKLKRFALDLPEYDAEEGIESYLKSVTDAVRNRPRWRVRRFATIGLFSFARQAMWSDLDPARWPGAARPEGHPLLTQIYGAIAGEQTDSIAPVHDVDQPQFEQQAPALVTDADASQLSAVIDAATGKNLVIQGPPGTGKSQAITNVIANALWLGKTILFVSEKMAALRVVKDRLDHMGLGAYCLEVHSAKASKTHVLKSIRDRMQAPRMISNAQEVERAREALRQVRQRLTDYSALMNSPAGSTGLTTHQVLWGDFTRTESPPTVPTEATGFRLADALTTDRFKLSELVGAGKALDDLAMSMGAEAEPARQPWRGVGNLNLSRFDRARAADVVGRWVAALERLQNLVTDFSAPGWPGLTSIRAVRLAVADAASLPNPPPGIEPRMLAVTVDDAARRSLAEWADLATRAHGLDSEIDNICLKSELEREAVAVRRLVDEATELGVEALQLDGLKQASDEAQQSAETLSQVIKLISDVWAMAGRDPRGHADLKAEAVVAGYLHALRQFPVENSRYRSTALADDEIVEDLLVAEATAQEALAAAADANFDDPFDPHLVETTPTVAELRHAAEVFRVTGFFGRLLGSEWRVAKTTWRKTFPGERRISPLPGAKRLNAAAIWKDRLARLDADASAKKAAGRHWNGVNTPFENLIAVATWMSSIRKITPLSEPGARELRELAFASGSDEFASILGLAEAGYQLRLLRAFQEAYAKKSSIKEEANRAIQHSANLRALVDRIARLGLRPNAPIRALSHAHDALVRASELRKKMGQQVLATPTVSAMAGESDAEKAKIVRATLEYSQLLLTAGVPTPVAKWLMNEQCESRIADVKRSAREIDVAIDQQVQAATQAQSLLGLRWDEWCGGEPEDALITFLLEKCQLASQNADSLDKQVQLLSTEVEANNLGLGELIRCWPAAGLAYSGVAWAIEAAFYRSAAETLMREHSVLARHAGNTHEQVRSRFQKLDKEILELNRQMIAAKLQSRPIPAGSRAVSTRDYTDNEMLRHQTGLQQPRIALRRLFSNAGAAIRAYAPCIMMSPMSVAQYLEPGKHNFDILVVDEASQMRPEDALGAMLRCSQAVIVGDPEQLPPSDFFVASADAAQQEEDDPEESILELGRRCWHPMRMLEVHYRSRHQSLIAYSNREFYDERLLVYPSPVLEDSEFGVTCRRIDGAYEVGQGRNQEEARAIVEEAAELMRKHLNRSIGIVAVNQAQRDLIETLMDERAAMDPDIQAYRQEWDGKLEDFFIKNLENVQGDERDIILISTVYGRTAEGVFHQNFGPINRAYGHRRLNVLFTRAKRKLTIFTSLDHAQIVADGHRRGVRVLKEFLEYASTKTITPGRRTGAEAESDFERWFLSRLKSAGYEAHPQVGVAKYRVDIGVLHPDKPGSYILGVECDGATYHSSKSARDRDRLRQDVLEGLNWKIHRVWSTDWYRDPEREFSRLIQNIEKLRTVQ